MESEARINPTKPSPSTPAKFLLHNEKPALERQCIRWGDSWTYDTSMTKTDRQSYKIAGPATWELIRAAYLGGESATALAERFGVSTHAIRKRITVEKWTKRDYAAALEARGVSREKPKPNYIEEGVVREEMRVAAEAREVREASAREAEMSALIDQIAAEEEAANIAAALERRALAQASAAMVQGRSKEAAALASMAEMMRRRAAAGPVSVVPPPPLPQALHPDETLTIPATAEELEQRAMAQAHAALREGRAGDAKAFMALAEQARKRVEVAETAREAEQEAVYLRQAEADDMACFIFSKAAYIANAMVHAPSHAPAAFQGLVKLWREKNLGEGEADAERAAAKLAEAQAAYLDGRFEETLPDYVREKMREDWKARRAELEGQPPVPEFWAEREREMRENDCWPERE